MKLSDLNKQNYPTSPGIYASLLKLFDVLTQIEEAYGRPLTVTSGLRDMTKHLAIYAEKNAENARQGKPQIQVPMSSKHLYGQAADISDVSGAFWNWCMDNSALMEELGVYFEDRAATPTWVHIQTLPPKSGKRVFKP